MGIITLSIIVFFGVSVINVILATFKTIVTARSDNKLSVSLANAISFGFYAIVIKQLVGFPTTTTVIVTLLANFLGVAFSMYILQYFKKDQLWKISVTVLNSINNADIVRELKLNDLAFSCLNIHSKKGELMGIDIYSSTQNESSIVKEILGKYEVKYHFSEVKNNL